PSGRRLPHAARPSLLARARVSDPSLSFLLARVHPSVSPGISPAPSMTRTSRPPVPPLKCPHDLPRTLLSFTTTAQTLATTFALLRRRGDAEPLPVSP